MKIAISGKGGVGKTTLSVLLASLYVEEGKKTLLVDADPDSNLAACLGLSQEIVNQITPISKMKALIEERTGAKLDQTGTLFKINPQVNDIPDRFSLNFNGIKLLIMGTVEKGKSGCMCPANTLLKNLMKELLVKKDEVVILDMEAGIEHLGRATAGNVDVFLVVVEPGLRSIQTAKNIQRLARDIGIKNILIVSNKVRNEQDYSIITQEVKPLEIVGSISYHEELIKADLMGKGILPIPNPKIKEEIENIKSAISKSGSFSHDSIAIT
ncbi:MAG: AAA family ATPase [bacterium]